MSRSFVLILVFLSAINIYSQNADDLSRRGQKSFDQGHYDSAIADFSRVITLTSQLNPQPDRLRNNFNEKQAIIYSARGYCQVSLWRAFPTLAAWSKYRDLGRIYPVS